MSCPIPKYKKLLEHGVEQWKVDAVRALRDTIPRKPNRYSWMTRDWAKDVAVLRDMSISVFEGRWTEEEFLNELEKIRRCGTDYRFAMKPNKTVADEVADHMLIYEIMGHDRDCSAFSFIELDKWDYKPNDDYSTELCEMHGRSRYKSLSYGKTKADAIARYKIRSVMKKKLRAIKSILCGFTVGITAIIIS